MNTFQQLSLRQCAALDAAKHGPGAVREYQAKVIARRLAPKHQGRRTNVGDPMHGTSFKKGKK